ncbi:MAG: DUF4358 domain-containing protein [Lachnospiraceae bacterium]
MKKGILAGIAVMLLTTGCKSGGSQSGTGEQSWRNDVPAKDLVKAVSEELGDEYWPDEELSPELLDDWYGISDQMYEEFYGQTPMISANVDSLIIVKSEEGHLKDVENAFDTYREAMIQDSLQYPMNIPKIQSSIIRTYGDYVCFVQLGGSLDGLEEDEEKAVEACRKMNEQALAAVERELVK